MVVSNLLFDIILFGALLLAAFADGASPLTAGVATLLVVAAATYVAAQEWCDALLRRRIWTQEALSTAIALSALGFIYFWWRNQSDFSLLVLSIGLMMASLMIAIALIAAFGAAFKSRDARPVFGLFLTLVGAYTLGVLGGILTLFLGGNSPFFAKLLVIAIGLFGWKVRQAIRPPHENIHATNQAIGETTVAAPDAPAAEWDLSLPATHATRWALIPRKGTLLDRFIPVLVLSAILFLAARQINTPELLSTSSAAPTDSNSAERN